MRSLYLIRRIPILLIALTPLANVRSDDFGIWTSARVNKEVIPNLTLAVEGELRLREYTKVVDCWAGYAEVSYLICPYLRTGAGYTIIGYNNRQTGWVAKHRINLFITGRYTTHHFTIALRERAQTTLVNHCEPLVSLRSRLHLDYNPPIWEAYPYLTIESYHTLTESNRGLEKMRYTIGGYYKISARSQIGLYYRYIDYDRSQAPSEHIMGVGYSIYI